MNMECQSTIKADINLKNIFSKPKYAKVHSVFENSFNIKFDDNIINFNYKKDYIASLGINISSLDKIYLKVGQICLISNEKIIIYSDKEYIIDLKNIDYIDLSPVIIRENQVNLFLNQIDEQKIYMKMGIEVNSELIQIMKDINLKTGFEKSINYLIGRGIGLTPTGDDIICGYIFSHIILDKNYYFKEYLKTVLNKTTDISKYNLKNINNSCFSSSLKKLNLSLKNEDKKDIENSINQILTYGHTSGADLLFGIIQGFIQIKNRLN